MLANTKIEFSPTLPYNPFSARGPAFLDFEIANENFPSMSGNDYCAYIDVKAKASQQSVQLAIYITELYTFQLTST